MTGRRLGATPLPEGRCAFHVWAPARERMEVRLLDGPERHVPMERDADGYWTVEVEAGAAPPGTRYVYRLDGALNRPDPASRFQPEGVHGPSAVVVSLAPARPPAPAVAPPVPLSDYVLYELHVGTFTPEGTFDAAIPRLAELCDLGVTAIELMPIAQFPGTRNWGYDGVYPFAAQNSYGGPDGLDRLVAAAHEAGLAVCLDVVYNHFGPEGSYLRDFGPYFTDRYRTPWGDALDFDGAASDHVRRFFIENALWWTMDCGIDAIRLDAIHAIFDASPYPFLEELADSVHGAAESAGRHVHLIAESDANDPRVIRPPEAGGYGLDAQWSDDFHHAVHALATNETHGYYIDYGRVAHLGEVWRGGYAYTGQRSRYRGRRHGHAAPERPAWQFVVCDQNHDQVGNRVNGDRLSTLVDLETRKVALAAVLLSPFTPLFWMGEEYGETRPFPYFIDHQDPALVEAVRKGRVTEFAAFTWAGEPRDPAARDTFLSAKLDHAKKATTPHRELLAYTRELLRLRRGLWDRDRPAGVQTEVEAREAERTLIAWIRAPGEDGCRAAVVLAFGGVAGEAGAAPGRLELPGHDWAVRLDSRAERWAGPGSPIGDVAPSGATLELAGTPVALLLVNRLS